MIDTLLLERKETDKMDKKNMFSLEGKIALVTGGAHGIGFTIAESYAEAGATVVFNCSNEESLKRGLAAYKEKGIDAHGYVCDVTDEEAVKKMIADIEEKIGTVDILVNNAGMIRRIPMHEMSAEEFRSAILHENLLFRPGMHYKPMHAVRTRLYEAAHGGSAGHAPEHAAGNTDGNAGRSLREEGNEQ